MARRKHHRSLKVPQQTGLGMRSSTQAPTGAGGRRTGVSFCIAQALAPGVGNSENDEIAPLCADADASPPPPKKKQKKLNVPENSAVQSSHVLDSLDPSELSALYGKGFHLLKGMGFSAGGLRADSLQAPLKAHNQGRSRRGVQSLEVQAPVAVTPILAAGMGKPIGQLLKQVLESMREAGDDDDAEELNSLAACVGMEGSLHSLGASWRERKRKPCPDISSSSSEESSEEVKACALTPSPLEQEAIDAVLHVFFGGCDFPVELTEQAQQLRWGECWHPRICRDYGDFVERFPDLFGVVPCPRPSVAIVLPLIVPSGFCWNSTGRYASWCKERRLNATGKAKQKWKQVENKVKHLCMRLAAAVGDDISSSIAADLVPCFAGTSGTFSVGVSHFDADYRA